MMKFNLLLVMAALAFAACKNAQKTPATAEATPSANAPAPEAAPGPWQASRVIHEEQPDSAYPYQIKEPPRRVEVPWDKIPRPSTSRRAFMASGWWYPLMAYQASDTTVHRNYLGKWLKFRDDQTFDILVKNQVMETGHWSFDEEKMIVYLACHDLYFNNTWAVQERGFRMIWKGNTDLNLSGTQIRMDNSPTPPPDN